MKENKDNITHDLPNKKKVKHIQINLKGLFFAVFIISVFILASLVDIVHSCYQNWDTKGVIICAVVFLIVITIGLYSLWALLDNVIKEKNMYKSTYRDYLINELKPDIKLDTKSDIDNLIHFLNATAYFSTLKDNETVIYPKPEKKDKDIIALMLKNNDEITEYFTISKKQAKSSYRFSVIASVIGMLMLAFAAYEAIVVDRVDLSIIGIVGGSITELVAGLVLWIHNKSAMQLNYYYDALHENEKFLAAINMADKLGDEKREEMYIEIIRKQIETHSNEKSNN